MEKNNSPKINRLNNPKPGFEKEILNYCQAPIYDLLYKRIMDSSGEKLVEDLFYYIECYSKEFNDKLMDPEVRSFYLQEKSIFYDLVSGRLEELGGKTFLPKKLEEFLN